MASGQIIEANAIFLLVDARSDVSFQIFCSSAGDLFDGVKQ
jgi:hypothetical protein